MLKNFILKFFKPRSETWYGPKGESLRYTDTSKGFPKQVFRSVYEGDEEKLHIQTVDGRLHSIERYSPIGSESIYYDDEQKGHKVTSYCKVTIDRETKKPISLESVNYKTGERVITTFSERKVSDNLVIKSETDSKGHVKLVKELLNDDGQYVYYRCDEKLPNGFNNHIIMTATYDNKNEIMHTYYNHYYRSMSSVIRRFDSQDRIVECWQTSGARIDHHSVQSYSSDGLEVLDKIWSLYTGRYILYTRYNKEKTRSYEYELPFWCRFFIKLK